MMTSLESATRLLAISKRLLAEQQAYERIQIRARKPDNTPKANQKAHVDLEWQAFHIAKVESELHAASVDAGLADLREPAHYAERGVKLTGFHEYLFVPAKPAALSGRAAA